MTVLAIDSASRDRAWTLLTSVDGTIIELRQVPGGELDRSLPGVIAGLPLGGVTAVVVLSGPGSYSGVRAGMAAALGIAAARSLPLHGLGNLTAVALAAVGLAANPGDASEFTAVADAGRGGVYAARFVRHADHAEQLSPVQRLSSNELDISGRVFGAAAITGVAVEELNPVEVLAAAVPRALALPKLDPLGLTAIHAESRPPRRDQAGERAGAL